MSTPVRPVEEDDDFGTAYERNPVCPWCGYVMRDPWELRIEDGDSAETECGDCEKPYRVVMHVSIKYSTTRSAK